MIKYFNIPVTGLEPVLVNASIAETIIQLTTTTTAIGYNATAAYDTITLTHAADASGVAVQNFLVEQLDRLMSTSYTNVAPVLTMPFAVSIVAVS
tara:strand:+ start:165 stop:449 length:285 start_codon:yes stop_codon:yes gene_type:complete